MPSFMSFQAAFGSALKTSESERLVLVIDEYPYVAKSSKSPASSFTDVSSTKIKIILN